MQFDESWQTSVSMLDVMDLQNLLDEWYVGALTTCADNGVAEYPHRLYS